MPPDAIKIGMVYSRQTIDAVCRSLKRSKVPIVLDPIFAAGTGAKLLRDDAFDSFVSKLIPRCTLATPNRIEAERLARLKIRTVSDAVEAAKQIIKLGAKNVIVKGGHFGASNVTDLLLESNGRMTKITNPRIKIGQATAQGALFISGHSLSAKGAACPHACRRQTSTFTLPSKMQSE